jgi:hypothetical protein
LVPKIILSGETELASFGAFCEDEDEDELESLLLDSADDEDELEDEESEELDEELEELEDELEDEFEDEEDEFEEEEDEEETNFTFPVLPVISPSSV